MTPDELPKGVIGRVEAAGFGYINIREEDSFKIAEQFIQLIKKRLDAIKADYEAELDALDDEQERST